MSLLLAWLMALALMVVSAGRLEAQGVARNFDELRLLVTAGDTVTVHDTAGATATGTIMSLSPSTLLLTSGREVREADVSRITQRKQDSLANGAAWGLVSGVVFGATMGGLMCENRSGCGRDALVSAAWSGAMGAGIGVGVDALITRRRVIYEAPGRSTSLKLAPVFGRGRKGAALSIAF